MPRFYCDYCDIYLKADGRAGRKQHQNGRKHQDNLRQYYMQFLKTPTLNRPNIAASIANLRNMVPVVQRGMRTIPMNIGGRGGGLIPMGRGGAMRGGIVPMMVRAPMVPQNFAMGRGGMAMNRGMIPRVNIQMPQQRQQQYRPQQQNNNNNRFQGPQQMRGGYQNGGNRGQMNQDYKKVKVEPRRY